MRVSLILVSLWLTAFSLLALGDVNPAQDEAFFVDTNQSSAKASPLKFSDPVFTVGTDTGGAQESITWCPGFPDIVCNANCTDTLIGCECTSDPGSMCDFRDCSAMQLCGPW